MVFGESGSFLRLWHFALCHVGEFGVFVVLVGSTCFGDCRRQSAPRVRDSVWTKDFKDFVWQENCSDEYTELELC